MSDPSIRPRSPGGRGKKPWIPAGGLISKAAEGGVKTSCGAYSSVGAHFFGKSPLNPIFAARGGRATDPDRRGQPRGRGCLPGNPVILRADRRLQSTGCGKAAGL